MRGISLEWIVLALFAIAWLAGSAVRLLRRRAMRAQAVRPSPLPSVALTRPTGAPIRPPGIVDARPAPGARPSARRAHRFSRSALLGSRRQRQDAVVAAVILGPCHAQRR